MKGHIRDTFKRVKKTKRQAGRVLIILLIAALIFPGTCAGQGGVNGRRADN